MDESSPFGAGAVPSYSIKKEFDNATVLLTGFSGYIGSLVAEQLLRTTNVKRIYALIRGKRGCPAEERMQLVLHSGLFHMLRDKPATLDKVCMLEGDLGSEDLGLSPQDLARALAEVDYIIHVAASIELEADVQHTLRSNYCGTGRLLRLAARMPRLRAFLHTSTAYVNINQPPGSSVEERLYPLRLGGQVMDHADIVEDLLSLTPDAANVRAQMYLDMWGFPNTYTMGKNITEQLVASAHRSGLPVAIVRPTLVCGLAGAPYPGYCGNLAGPIGLGVAMAVGLFDRLESVAMVPTHVWDAVPGDVVSSVIIAAAAATSARVRINEYAGSPIGRDDDPMVVHAGTSTTYPISFVEAAHAGITFVRMNPPPFRLPGGSLFSIPLDYRPDAKAVARCKYWTAWKVWGAVHLLELLGQHKTARRLKYGHMSWVILNSSKTDRNLFFGSRNLKQLEARLDEADAASRHYTITWTIKNGGWPRYIATNIASMYRLVFGISDVKGLGQNDFKFIPNQPLPPRRADAKAAGAAAPEVADAARVSDQDGGANRDATRAGTTPLLQAGSNGSNGSNSNGNATAGREASTDFIEAGLVSTASTFATIPTAGARMATLLEAPGSGGGAPSPRPTRTRGVHGPSRSGGSGGSEPRHGGGLTATVSENVGGIRGLISSTLGSSLSYRPASTDDVQAGTLNGGVMHTLLSPPVQRITQLDPPLIGKKGQ